MQLQIGAFLIELRDLQWPAQRGEPVEVEIAGGNLAAPVKLRPATNSEAATIPVALPNSPSLPLQFALSDKEEMLESDGLLEIVKAHRSKPLREMKHAILDDVAAWRHGPVTDDMSLVLLEVN